MTDSGCHIRWIDATHAGMWLDIPVTNQRQPTEGSGEPERVLGTQARAYREKLGMTQAEVAKAMTARGFVMRQSTITKIENAQRPVRVNEATALAAVLHATLPDLLSDPAQRDALAAARDEERELAGQIRQAEQAVEDCRTVWIASEGAMVDADAKLRTLQARHAEAAEKLMALAAAGRNEA